MCYTTRNSASHAKGDAGRLAVAAVASTSRRPLVLVHKITRGRQRLLSDQQQGKTQCSCRKDDKVVREGSKDRYLVTVPGRTFRSAITVMSPMILSTAMAVGMIVMELRSSRPTPNSVLLAKFCRFGLVSKKTVPTFQEIGKKLQRHGCNIIRNRIERHTSNADI